MLLPALVLSFLISSHGLTRPPSHLPYGLGLVPKRLLAARGMEGGHEDEFARTINILIIVAELLTLPTLMLASSPETSFRASAQEPACGREQGEEA